MTEMFDPGGLGDWSAARPYQADAATIAAYARATNDRRPDALAGEVAPPVFAIVPAMGIRGGSVVRAEHRAEIGPRAVHGEHWIRQHRPIRAGDELSTRACAVGVHAKASGVTVVNKFETSSTEGLVTEQFFTAFYRGVSSAVEAGEAAPTLADRQAGEAPGPLVAAVAYRIDDDQPARYADASGDHNPIHLDDAAARVVGLPGVIVHGMCTLAFATRAIRAALAEYGRSTVVELGARFSRPLLPGGELVTRIYDLGDDGTHRAVRFECSDESGQRVLSAGYASLG
jgi:acyl dehydratase